jgi:hypothetical protein
MGNVPTREALKTWKELPAEGTTIVVDDLGKLFKEGRYT